MTNRENLYKITAASLEKYLLFNNWREDYGFPNKKLRVFQLNEDTIVVPSSEKYKDFYIVLPDVLETLADIYDKTSKEIIKQITSSYYDLLEFRIKSKISEDGELPLEYAANCIEGLKELVLYSAHAEEKKEPVCLRVTNNAKEILDNFKLAQTEVGSFVINLDIKVAEEEGEQYSLPVGEPDVSIEHKIVKRIGKAIQQIDDVASQKSNLDEILPDAYKSGITANMCDALMKLKPENADVSIVTKIRYASAITQRPDDVEIIEIKNNHFYTMDEISRRYKAVEKIENVVVRGIIKTLRKDPAKKDQFNTGIDLVTYVDNKLRTIKAVLSDDDHKRACDAFRDGDEVEIQGMLDMSNKKWEMKHIEKFTLVND